MAHMEVVSTRRPSASQAAGVHIDDQAFSDFMLDLYSSYSYYSYDDHDSYSYSYNDHGNSRLMVSFSGCNIFGNTADYVRCCPSPPHSMDPMELLSRN